MAKQKNKNSDATQKKTGQSNQSEEEKFENNCKQAFGENYKKYFLNPDNLSYDDYIQKLKDFIKYKAQNISTSQIRNIFTIIKKEQELDGLKRIRPKLAYTYGRAEKNKSLKELIFLMDSQIQGLNDQTEIPKLKDFFEAIVAYHKYYGGKE